jgi:hypothetical protein
MVEPNGNPPAQSGPGPRDQTAKRHSKKAKVAQDIDLFSLSWSWIKGTLLQTVGVGGIATVFTAVFWTAGYLIIVRRNMTFGVPNAASGAAAYQQAGADWAMDIAGALREGLVGVGWIRVMLLLLGITAAFVLLRKGLRRKMTRWQRATVTIGVFALHLVLAFIVVKDALEVLRYFEASNVTVRERNDLLLLRESNAFAGRFLDAFVHNEPRPMLADYHRRLERWLWIGLIGVLAAWAIHRNFKLPWASKRRLIGTQVALALLLVGHTSLLAQLYGLITAITRPQCVLIHFHPEFTKQLVENGQDKTLLGLVLSDSAFGADEIHVIEFDVPNQLHVYARSDIIKYEFHYRTLCGQLRL